MRELALRLTRQPARQSVRCQGHWIVSGSIRQKVLFEQDACQVETLCSICHDWPSSTRCNRNRSMPATVRFSLRSIAMDNISLAGVCDRNLSWFITESKLNQVKYCVLCGSRCDVERKVNRPTSWAMAMAKKSRLHDRHECPYRNHRLHVLSVRHRELALKLPEGCLRTLAAQDFEKTLRELQLEIAILEK